MTALADGRTFEERAANGNSVVDLGPSGPGGPFSSPDRRESVMIRPSSFNKI
jgi:hypothetical protein